MAVLQGLSEKILLLQKQKQEGSIEPSPARDCLTRKIEALRAHPAEIFNFMVVSGTPRLGKLGVVVQNFAKIKKMGEDTSYIIHHTWRYKFEKP